MKRHPKLTTTFILLALLLASHLFIIPAQAATDTSAGSVLTLDLAASESVTVVTTGATYTFTLDGAATWTGRDCCDLR